MNSSSNSQIFTAAPNFFLPIVDDSCPKNVLWISSLHPSMKGCIAFWGAVRVLQLLKWLVCNYSQETTRHSGVQHGSECLVTWVASAI